MFVMLHIPEALRHTLMPWTPTWVNQEKISTFDQHLSQNSNLGEPGKDINICLKFCLKMFVMLQNVCYVNQEKMHIPEALRHTVMPWTPTWVNQEKISTFV